MRSRKRQGSRHHIESEYSTEYWNKLYWILIQKKLHKLEFQWIRQHFRYLHKYNNFITCWLRSDCILKEICKLISICCVELSISNFVISLRWLLIKIFVFLNPTNRLGFICSCLIFTVESFLVSKMTRGPQFILF